MRLTTKYRALSKSNGWLIQYPDSGIYACMVMPSALSQVNGGSPVNLQTRILPFVHVHRGWYRTG